MPFLWPLTPLGICLVQVANAAVLHGSKHAKLVLPGQEPVLKVYGTLRCFSATHRAARVITVRNQRELPTCLHFDPHFRKSIPQTQISDLRCVTPTFGEWLMGLPRGWTALQPLQESCLRDNRSGLLQKGGPGVSAGPPQPWRSLSLFSGCGALDYALPWCTPVAYCELDPDACSVLRARMADGSLPEAPLYHDVRALTKKELRGQIDVIVAGFPCVDLCKAGKKQGLGGSESTLVWEVCRLARDSGVLRIFLENVDNFRFMEQFWRAVLLELTELGFQIEWVSLSGTHVGSPQRRRRVFLLARRGAALLTPFGPSLPRGPSGVSADAQLPFLRLNKGLHFNAGRPAAREWMMSKEQYRQECHRLKMIGNAVIPLQANLAARILSSLP